MTVLDPTCLYVFVLLTYVHLLGEWLQAMLKGERIGN